jgi:hypothetical protein
MTKYDCLAIRKEVSCNTKETDTSKRLQTMASVTSQHPNIDVDLPE